ncbi:MAG: 4-alpha-glucanotransferase [Bifidobacterium sp.]
MSRVGDRTQDATLISAPERIPMLPAMEHDQLWGWMAQLYSIRSAGSWGVGDFEDLQDPAWSMRNSKTGADFMLVNPLHACEPVAPLTPSPYLPISRRFINFTYIRPEAIEEYAGLGDDLKSQIGELHAQAEPLNGDAQIIDRDSMWRVKMHALWLIFKAGRSEARQKREFDRLPAHESGEELEAYATWCLCYDKWGAPTGEADNWVQRHTTGISDEVQGLRRAVPRHIELLPLAGMDRHRAAWSRAAGRPQGAGMQIGIMADMAVGVHPSGSDVWWNPERFAKGATVGAPPDMFNQQGQDWSQPPLNPIELENTGYLTYRHMVQGMFAHAGAVRIDHILGLFRLWWIPSGHSAQ